MAIPNYTTDLTTIAIGSLTVDAWTWDESTDAWWDTAGAMVDDANLYYNGTACVSAQYTKLGNGTWTAWPWTIMYQHTAAFTIPLDWAALIHHLWAAPPALNTIDNATSAGINILAWNTLWDFLAWKASWSDFAPAPRGWWANYAINPAIWTPDHTVWTPDGTYTTIWVSVSATAQARWNPQACNAVRYWRCESRFTDWDIANWYATFNWFALVDSASANKWNLIDPIAWWLQFQWLMSLGLTATAVDFRDANVNINIINTINVTSNFNRIEVHNATSNIEWTAISISALGTVSKWKFEVIDNATILKTSCTFTDMDSFIYKSNTTIDTSIFRRCGLITQWGATITDSTIDDAVWLVWILSDNPSLISNTDFNSDWTGHWIEITTPWTYTFTWNTFTDYAWADWSTGNEAIYNNSWWAVIINISGWDTPTIRNGAGATTTVNNATVLTLIDLPNGIEVRIKQWSHTLQHTQDVIWNEVVYSYNYTWDEKVKVSFVWAWVIQSKTIVLILSNVNLTIPVTFDNDPSYIS